MINWNRVFAMVFRYFLYMKHNLNRFTDMFYWPTLDLFIWGLTGLYLASLAPNNKDYVFVILNGLVFWIVIWRAQYEINVNILSEIWDKNIVNIFASPLTLLEWILSLAIVGLIKMVISLSFSAVVAYVFYHYNIFMFGFWIFPIVLSLIITGWAIGFFVAGFIIRYGYKVETLAWAGVTLIAPFSVLYYPLSVLPQWAQKISFLIPSTYVFEAMRSVLFTGTLPYDKLSISFAINIPFLCLSLWFFIFMFNKSRKAGLGRLI